MLRLYDDPTNVNEQESNINTSYQLSQNYPNPFNPSTIISYSVPNTTVMLNSFQHLNNNDIPNHTSTSSVTVRDDNINVTLKVYYVLGKEVATLVNQKQSPGNYQVEFDASTSSASGKALPSGVYFYRFTVGSFSQTRKMILLR